MKVSTMTHNANQIALFFATYPREEAVVGIANHISKFWERRMRNQMEEYVAAGGSGLHELVLEALQRLRAAAQHLQQRLKPQYQRFFPQR